MGDKGGKKQKDRKEKRDVKKKQEKTIPFPKQDESKSH